MSVLGAVMSASPVVLALTTFSAYVAAGNELSASKIFTAVSVLNLLRFPIALIPFGGDMIMKILISLERLQFMLEAEEADTADGAVEATTRESGGKLAVKDAAESPTSVGKEAVPSRKEAEVGLVASTISQAEFGYPFQDKEQTGKGKGKGKRKMGLGCFGCLTKGSGKKGKGNGEGKENGDGSDKEKPEAEDEDDSIVELKRGGEVIKFKRVLSVDHIDIPRGSLTMVVGPVGSGKSSLLAALLREADAIKGASVFLPGPVAYAAQVPWIMNATLKVNVECGSQFIEEGRYSKIIQACCLEDDLELLPGGDSAEIGERGVNLSGGQRARVALARACYAQAEVYLLDDPLAAVDAHVGRRLFDDVFGSEGLLSGKTRVLVTHQVQYLPEADHILVLEEGHITASGTFEELSARGLAFEEILGEAHEAAKEEAPKAQKRPNIRSVFATTKSKSSVGSLTTTEEKDVGAVKFKTYKDYFIKGWGLGFTILAFILFLVVLVMKLVTDFWLAYWTAEVDPFGWDQVACILFYCCICFLYSSFVWARSLLCVAIGAIRACRRIYQLLLRAVFACPTIFFDTTPTGRILNRFTGDIDKLDNSIARSVLQLANCTESVLTGLIGMLVVNPLVLVAILPCAALYLALLSHYRPSSRDVQRLEAITKTPIFNRISETLGGLQTIRAFGMQSQCVDRFLREVVVSQACSRMKVRCTTWLALRLELISLGVASTTAILPVLPIPIANSNPALVGLALTYCLEFSRYIQALTKFSAEFEQQFTSPERIFEYCNLTPEAAAVCPEDASLPRGWPSKGVIEYKNVTMRYRPELDPALTNLTFSVNAGEKLGIVGRTGSGKSSIIVSLLRLTELAEGQVLIDGVDIGKLGLLTLRQSLSMIPQEPVFFGNMTLRRNLDPFNEYSEDVINEALMRCMLLASPEPPSSVNPSSMADPPSLPKRAGTSGFGSKRTISSLPDGLDTVVIEGGASFSVGERQLLCLARAVLRNSRIVLLDEATASVDNDTDAVIQQTIRDTFNESTVLCIAHRIRTILDSDKVLVMGEGACQEIGPPQELLATGTSLLRALAIESNIDVPLVQESIVAV